MSGHATFCPVRRPRVAVTAAEPMPGWWNGLTGARRQWFLTMACGHFVLRRAVKAPAWVRCEGCPR